jgi:hypothetical protein
VAFVEALRMPRTTLHSRPMSSRKGCRSATSRLIQYFRFKSLAFRPVYFGCKGHALTVSLGLRARLVPALPPVSPAIERLHIRTQKVGSAASLLSPQFRHPGGTEGDSCARKCSPGHMPIPLRCPFSGHLVCLMDSSSHDADTVKGISCSTQLLTAMPVRPLGC